jgi:DNA-binding CsgD family transcriptional regulator/tetratricopeptide (TPR) repeat protein
VVQAGGAAAIVGRDAEMALLRAALDDARAGRGRLVLLSGEPGIGKSTLALALVQQAAADGLRVSVARAPETAGVPAYWIWMETLRGDLRSPDAGPIASPNPVLARILPQLAGGGPGAVVDPSGESEVERFRLADAITSTLLGSARDACRVAVLDDLHAADASSLAVLAHLATRLDSGALLVVATHRDAPDEVTSALQDVVARVSRERCTTRIALSGLDVAGVQHQLAVILGHDVDVATAARVYARTGGNPFFTAEVGRLLAVQTTAGAADAQATVPPRIRDVITWRLHRLPASTRALLETAALIGHELPVDLLAAASSMPAASVLATLEPAVSAAIIGPGASPARVRFTHALVAETIAASLPLNRTAALHQRIAAAIESRRATGLDEWLPALALHWSQTAPTEHASRRTVETARGAAEQAEARLAHGDAVPFWSMALDAAGRAGCDAGVCAELHLGLGRSLFRSGDVAGAIEESTLAAREARSAARPDLEAAAALVVEGVTDPRWATQLVALAEQALQRLDDRELAMRARLHAQIGQLNHHTPAATAEREREETARAVELAESSGDPHALQAALRAKQQVLSGPDGVDGRLQNAARMIQLGRSSGDAWAELWGRLWSVDALLQLGRLGEAEAELAELEPVVARVAWPVARWHQLRAHAGILQARGRFDDALRIAREALAQISGAGLTEAEVMHAAFLEAHADLVGDVDGEEEARRRLREWAMTVPGAAIWAILALVRAGQQEEARTLYARLPPADAYQPPPYARTVALRVRLLAAIRLKMRDDVVLLLQRFEPYAGLHVAFGSGAFLTFGSGRLYTGMAAAFLGDLDRAVADITGAVDDNARCGAVGMSVVARQELAEVLVRRNAGTDLDAARRHATAVLHEAQRLGMGPCAERASALLAGLPRRRLRSDALTPRELEVARLVAEGLTNRQVAVRLHISERTVENHLDHIFTKLGVASRSQVAAWVASTAPAEG